VARGGGRVSAVWFFLDCRGGSLEGSGWRWKLFRWRPNDDHDNLGKKISLRKIS